MADNLVKKMRNPKGEAYKSINRLRKLNMVYHCNETFWFLFFIINQTSRRLGFLGSSIRLIKFPLPSGSVPADVYHPLSVFTYFKVLIKVWTFEDRSLKPHVFAQLHNEITHCYHLMNSIINLHRFFLLPPPSILSHGFPQHQNN